MPSGYLVNSIDLDDIFDALETTKRADVGYSVSGVDISNRYEPSAGSYDQIGYNTNYSSAGTDLRYLFRAAAYVPPTATPTPTFTPTPTPTSTPEPTATPTPTPTSTPEPTATPEPTPTPTPVPEYDVQAENNDGGNQVTFDGDGSGNVIQRVAATYNLIAYPSANYVFSGWTVFFGDTPANDVESTTVALTQNSHYQANYLPYPTLQAENSAGGAAVSIDGDGSGNPITRAPGTYNLIAYPDSGYTFDYMETISGATPTYVSTDGSGNVTYSVTVSANTTNHYVAHFI
jgi:hypothetical protein